MRRRKGGADCAEGIERDPARRTDAEVSVLVERNMALVQHFAARYTFDGDDHAEVFSKGMEGLLAAAQRWDGRRDMPFGTYAGYSVKWKICSRFHRQSKKKRGQGVPHLPLDAPLSEEDERTVGEVIADERAADPGDAHRLAEELAAGSSWLAALDPRSREVLERRFGLGDAEPQTLEQVSAVLGVTRERVRQVQNAALAELRKAAERTARGDPPRVEFPESARPAAARLGRPPGSAQPKTKRARRPVSAVVGGYRVDGVYSRDGALAAVVARLKVDGAVRSVARATGVSHDTVSRVLRQMKAQGFVPPRCPCGGLGGHRGRCWSRDGR